MYDQPNQTTTNKEYLESFSIPDGDPTLDPEEMLALLANDDVEQLTLAARAFCEIEDPRAIPRLIAMLAHPCPLLRVSVVYALGKNSNQQTVSSLIQVLNEDFNGYVRKGAVWALGNSNDRRSLKPLLKSLREDIPAVRLWAASGLAQIAKLSYEDVISSLPALIEGLRRDPVAVVRSNCVWTVGQLCQELPLNVVYATAVDALIEALVEDEDLGVKEDAKGAILRLGDARGLQMIEELELEGII
jgi:HEAT repeat protein